MLDVLLVERAPGGEVAALSMGQDEDFGELLTRLLPPRHPHPDLTHRLRQTLADPHVHEEMAMTETVADVLLGQLSAWNVKLVFGCSGAMASTA